MKTNMNGQIARMLLILIFGLLPIPIFAADQPSSGSGSGSGSKAVEIPGNIPQTGDEALAKKDAEVLRGKLLKVQDQLYTLETSPGRQVNIRAGKATKFEGNYQGTDGDWVEATVTPDMHIQSIKKSTPGYTMEGSVLKVDGDFFVVKDDQGKEIRLQKGNDTKLIGTHKVGERIRAEYTPDGKALSVKPAKIPVGPEGG
jgi:hypothetical protein